MLNLISLNENTLHVKFSGDITADEIIEVNSRLYINAASSDIDRQLWSFEEVKNFIFKIEDVYEVVAFDKIVSKKHPNMKVAIFTNSPIIFSYARMFEILYADGPWNIGLFYDMYAAKSWLYS